MPKVVILGGGVAGLSAAHELIERGFEVDVYEKKTHYLGGKARSVDVPGSNLLNASGYLPGEHGFRFFPGFYRHITDTMKRIPFTRPDGTQNKRGVFDNLADVSRVGIMRNGKNPIITIVSFPKSLGDLESALATLHTHDTGLEPGEAKIFAKKIWQLMTSSRERRNEEYEKIGWSAFMDASRHSAAYNHLLVEGLTRTLVAANANYASTKTGGDIFIQLLFNIGNPGMHTDRVLNGPTNTVWLKPWEAYLRQKGVRFFKGAQVEKLIVEGSIVRGAVIHDRNNAVGEALPMYDPPASGDYFLLATPVEVAAAVIPEETKSKVKSLNNIDRLAADVAWMNGIQFYLNKTLDIVRGHCIYVDSEWAITSISQLPFWPDYDISQSGDGTIKSILSVDVSNWENLSPADPAHPELPPMRARDCQNFNDIAERVWLQLKRSLNVNGEQVLTDDMRQGVYQDGNKSFKGYYLDHSLNEEVTPNAKDPSASVVGEARTQAFTLVDHEPLLVNTVDSWVDRPDARLPEISNLLLASDYVRTNTDLATMEGANEAARRAVNTILEKTGSAAARCEIWPLQEPVFFAPFKWLDAWRFHRGMPYNKPPGWFEALMVLWGIIYAIGFLGYTLWTRITSWFNKSGN